VHRAIALSGFLLPPREEEEKQEQEQKPREENPGPIRLQGAGGWSGWL